MLSVTIDTAVFAPPAPGSPKEMVYGFIDTLLEWRNATDGGRAKLYTSRYAAEVLMHGGLYPLRPHLRELLRQAEVYEYDANTIAVVAETLLNSEKLEDALQISEVLVDGLTIEPDVFGSNTPPELRAGAERSAVVLSLAGRYCDDTITCGHAIAIRAKDFASAIRVRGLLQDIEHDRADLADIPKPPDYFEGSAFVCSSLHKLLTTMDATAILRSAGTASQVRAAITVAWYQRQTASGMSPDWANLSEFEVGREFLPSLLAHHVTSKAGLASRILRAATATICHENLSATHWLRTGSGGNDPQRMRGSDAAWRRDVDYEYHLHYWECDDGKVELAVVVVHSDLSIPE
ncbi:MAG: hypothetical protein INH43_26995 [Acidobacteriaceae bacterium]|nr:hypothetical protein [Acidobacteriaceae bacterium]